MQASRKTLSSTAPVINPIPYDWRTLFITIQLFLLSLISNHTSQLIAHTCTAQLLLSVVDPDLRYFLEVFRIQATQCLSCKPNPSSHQRSLSLASSPTSHANRSSVEHTISTAIASRSLSCATCHAASLSARHWSVNSTVSCTTRLNVNLQQAIITHKPARPSTSIFCWRAWTIKCLRHTISTKPWPPPRSHNVQPPPLFKFLNARPIAPPYLQPQVYPYFSPPNP